MNNTLRRTTAQICQSKFYNNSKTIGVPKYPIPPCVSYKISLNASVDLLLSIFRSGTEEQYAEKERLLQQVTDLQREFANYNKKKKKKSCKIQDLREASKTNLPRFE
jgi:hypothetical protein